MQKVWFFGFIALPLQKLKNSNIKNIGYVQSNSQSTGKGSPGR